MSKERIPWLVLHDEADGTWPPLAKTYGLPGIPAMILIGRDGFLPGPRAAERPTRKTNRRSPPARAR